VTTHDVVFVLVALVTAGAGVLTVTSRNLVHAALYLAATLAGIAGVFLLLAADLLALVQLLIYVGAVAVLFLFGLMLTRAPIGREALDSQNRALGIKVAGGLFVVLAVMIVHAFGSTSVADVSGPRVTDIGVMLFAGWVLPFELLSVLLLAALIGAVVVARREAGESGEEAGPTRIELSGPPATDADRRGELADGPAELTGGGARSGGPDGGEGPR